MTAGLGRQQVAGDVNGEKDDLAPPRLGAQLHVGEVVVRSGLVIFEDGEVQQAPLLGLIADRDDQRLAVDEGELQAREKPEEEWRPSIPAGENAAHHGRHAARTPPYSRWRERPRYLLKPYANLVSRVTSPDWRSGFR
ncbi:MAG: hypothetical protein HYV63_29985 [Candidatus Schekmanbacteria bacterium]|nr:hypothetical protein [Candidatus Schekmanbacteria bacterium]